MIFGGFLVLVGLILFAVRKLKQTPAQDATENEARQAAVESLKKSMHQAPAALSRDGTRLLEDVGAKFRKAKADDFVARLCIGIFVALCTAPVSGFFLTWWVLPLIVLIYSLRDRPAFSVMSSLLRFNVFWTLLHAIILTGFLILDLPFLDFLGPIALSLSCTGISLATLSYIRRRHSRMSSGALQTHP